MEINGIAKIIKNAFIFAFFLCSFLSFFTSSAAVISVSGLMEHGGVSAVKTKLYLQATLLPVGEKVEIFVCARI